MMRQSGARSLIIAEFGCRRRRRALTNSTGSYAFSFFSNL